MSERSRARVELEHHRWTGPYDGGWYCLGCGLTWAERAPPPAVGCARFGERVRRAQERPTGTTRQYLTELLREAVERLELQGQRERDQPPALDVEVTPAALNVSRRFGEWTSYLAEQGVTASERADVETVLSHLQARLEALQQTLHAMDPWQRTLEAGDIRCFFCGAGCGSERDTLSAVHTPACIWANLHPEVRREGYDPDHAVLGLVPRTP